MKLEDLIDMAFQKASAKIDAVNPESYFSDKEKNVIANAVGIAAIKFADLQNPRQTDYVFDLDKLVSFEGKTGPYILYQIVRIKSMLRKAGEFKKTDFTVDDNTQNLALLLAQFPNVIDGVVQGYTPHILCDFVYKLAQEFGRFYAANPILVEKDEARRNAYLSVCAILEDTLSKCMELMGIDIPEQM